MGVTQRDPREGSGRPAAALGASSSITTFIKTMLKIATAGLFVAGSLAAFAGHLNLSGPTGHTSRQFPIHSIESAPEATRATLEWYKSNFKFVPHLVGIMAESPVLLQTYWSLQKNLTENGSLTAPENNIVQFAIAMENECQYCAAGHTMAGKMYFGSSEAELEALRTKSKLPSAKFNALRTFTIDVYNHRGRVTNDQLDAFLKAGYSRQQALDVVANISAKVMTNFTNKITLTLIDAPHKPLA